MSTKLTLGVALPSPQNADEDNGGCGAISFEGGPANTPTAYDVTFENVVVRGFVINANAGIVYMADTMPANVVFKNCDISANTNKNDGFPVILHLGFERMPISFTDGTKVESNAGIAVYVSSYYVQASQKGAVTFTRSHILDNAPTTPAAVAAAYNRAAGLLSFCPEDGCITIEDQSRVSGNAIGNYYISAGVVFSLPTPPGYWMANELCQVFRRPCIVDDEDVNYDAECAARFQICSITADDSEDSPPTVGITECEAASWGGTWNAIGNECQHDEHATWAGGLCRDALFRQTCDWTSGGTYSASLGQLIVQMQVGSTVTVDLPIPCAAGKYGDDDQNNQGSSLCAGECPEGYYCPEPATSDPKICPAGSYCPVGSVSPVACPGGSYAKEQGSTQPSDCTGCAEGAYEQVQGNSSVCTVCDAAVPGIDCTIPGIELGNLPVKAAYWRSYNESADIRPCYTAAACKGFETRNKTDGRRLAAFDVATQEIDPASTFGDGLCADGHTGAFCVFAHRIRSHLWKCRLPCPAGLLLLLLTSRDRSFVVQARSASRSTTRD